LASFETDYTGMHGQQNKKIRQSDVARFQASAAV